MKYGIFFAALALLLVPYGWWLGAVAPWLACLLWWAALAFGLVGVAYMTNRPQLVGKTPEGRLPWSRGLLLWPYLALMYGTWRLYRAPTTPPSLG